MTERFKVHKMIEGYTSGEDIDVDFLKELIAEDRLVDDLTMHIEDTKENKILTYRECVNLLNENERLKEENEVLKSTNMEYEDALGRLEEENERLKKDALNYYLNETLVEDIKTLLVVLAFCEFPKTNRLSTDEFSAIARLQGFLCENIIDLEELEKEVKK